MKNMTISVLVVLFCAFSMQVYGYNIAVGSSVPIASSEASSSESDGTVNSGSMQSDNGPSGEYNVYHLDGSKYNIDEDIYSISGNVDYSNKSMMLRFKAFMVGESGALIPLRDSLNGDYCKNVWKGVYSAEQHYDEMNFTGHSGLTQSCIDHPEFGGNQHDSNNPYVIGPGVCNFSALWQFAKNKAGCGDGCSQDDIMSEYIQILTDDNYSGAPTMDDDFCSLNENGTPKNGTLSCNKKYCYCYEYNKMQAFKSLYSKYLPYKGRQDFACTFRVKDNSGLGSNSKVVIQVLSSSTTFSFPPIPLSKSEDGWNKVASNLIDMMSSQIDVWNGRKLTPEQLGWVNSVKKKIEDRKTDIRAKMLPPTRISLVKPDVVSSFDDGGGCSLIFDASDSGLSVFFFILVLFASMFGFRNWLSEGKGIKK